MKKYYDIIDSIVSGQSKIQYFGNVQERADKIADLLTICFELDSLQQAALKKYAENRLLDIYNTKED